MSQPTAESHWSRAHSIKFWFMTNHKPCLSLLLFSYENIKHDTLKAQQPFGAMHVWLFYNTVSIKKVNVQYTTLLNSLFSICLSKQKVWNPMRMKECNAKMLRLLLKHQCEHVRFMRASKEETPPSINLLVVDSNALLTRLQFYLGSWQLEAEGLYSRDSGIMNSTGLTSILF